LALLVAATPVVADQPPKVVIEDLSKNPLVQVIKRSIQIPLNVRDALAKLMGDTKILLADRGDELQPDFRVPGAKELPSWRFLFGFSTNRQTYLYIERGAPAASAYAIVFDCRAKTPRFIWAGADLDPPYARNPNGLRKRIIGGDLLTHDPSVW
jgi:hypothetical protein